MINALKLLANAAVYKKRKNVLKSLKTKNHEE